MSDIKEKNDSSEGVNTAVAEVDTVSVAPKGTPHPRVLSEAQVALMALASTVGTGYFVNMGNALTAAGPLPLVLGYAFWCLVIYFVSDACREMVVRLPLESSFIRFNGRWIDEAWGVATSYNVWLAVISFFVFEITAFNAVVDFWKPLNPAILTTALLVIYAILHLWDSRFFGRVEIFTTSVKLLVAIGLLIFTLVAMCGGNPKRDAFGFRYWKDPGPIVAKGAGKQLAAFWKVLLNASFAVAGPDAISIAAGDVRMPRRVLPVAYKSVYFRFLVFFLLGPIALGCLTPSNDPGLLLGQKEGSPGAARSPWVAGIKRLDIPILPHIVNAALLFTMFSCANMMLFNASKILHSLAEDGYAPKVLKRKNRNGVPYVAFLFNLAVGCLAYLQCGSGSSVVLNWFTSLAGSGQIMIWILILTAYLAFYRACRAQGLDRNTLPYKSWGQPYTSIFALVVNLILLVTNGYSVFLRDAWNVADFIYAYFAIFWFVVWYVGWKLLKRTKYISPKDADLFTGMDEIDQEEEIEAESRLALTKKEKIMAYIL